MDKPASLYRYRSFPDEILFARELKTLKESYLFAGGFHAMNDPMEALVQWGRPGDAGLEALLATHGKSLTAFYTQAQEMVDRFGLISFSSTVHDLPMWAYYASNFEGMCLEFDTERLTIGALQNESLLPVTYAASPLPAIPLDALGAPTGRAVVLERLTLKPEAWAHEREWRYVTGEQGARAYRDDALTRIYLGPRIRSGHEAAICAAMANRPVDVLKGRLDGYALHFDVIQAGKGLAESERVSTGTFDPERDLYARDDLAQFLSVPIEHLEYYCRAVATAPNFESFGGIDLSAAPTVIYMHIQYRLRSGLTVYERRHFDHHLQRVARGAPHASASLA